jgi:hypothetical protein
MMGDSTSTPSGLTQARIEQFLYAGGLKHLLYWFVHSKPALPNHQDTERQRLQVCAAMIWQVVSTHPEAVRRLAMAPLLRQRMAATLIDTWHAIGCDDILDGAAQVCMHALSRAALLWDDKALLDALQPSHAKLRAVCLRIWNTRTNDAVEAVAVTTVQSVALHVAGGVLRVTASDVVSDPDLLASWFRLLEWELRQPPTAQESKVKATVAADGGTGLLKEQVLDALTRWCVHAPNCAATTEALARLSIPLLGTDRATSAMQLLVVASEETRRPRTALVAKLLLHTLADGRAAAAMCLLPSWTQTLACWSCHSYTPPECKHSCPRCKKAVYCSDACRRDHWPQHKQTNARNTKLGLACTSKHHA